MQTRDVLRTITWLEHLFPPEVKDGVFMRHFLFSRERKEIPPRTILMTMNLLARLTPLVQQHPHAPTVLKAFDLSPILDEEFQADFAAVALGGERPPQDRDRFEFLRNWYVMGGCLTPMVRLTVPGPLAGETAPDDIISIQILGDGRESLPASMFERTFRSFELIYATIGKLNDIAPDLQTLDVIKIESGSAVRIDFRGSADLVKCTKEFFIEAWQKIRHRRIDEVLEKNRAFSSTLGVIEDIQKGVSKGTFTPEEGEHLKHTLLKETLSLFKHGALITDIPIQETVDNAKLLAGFSQQLLLPPPEEFNVPDDTIARELQPAPITPKKNRNQPRRRSR
jgi:hypothetical protein